MNKGKQSWVKLFLIFLLLGFGAGCISWTTFTILAPSTTGMLIAPKSGKETTREGMKKKAVNTVENVKDTVRKKGEMDKECAVHAKQEVSNNIKDVHEKKKAIKKDIKEAHHKITADIEETAENVSDEINKSVK